MSRSREGILKSDYDGPTMKRFVGRVIITFLVLIMLTLTAAYFLLFLPTQNQLKRVLIENYDNDALIRYKFFDIRVSLSLQSAENLTSSQNMMNTILAYEAGEMGLEELKGNVQDQYSNYVQDIDYLVQAERSIDGNIIGSMKKEQYTYDSFIPDEIYKNDRIMDDFCLEDGEIYYELLLPIYSDSRVIGHDRLIFCFSEYLEIIASENVSSTIINKAAHDELTNKGTLIQASKIGEIINKDQVFYHIASLNDNYYFVTSQREADLLLPVNEIRSHASLLGVSSFVLLAIIAFPVIILLARKEFLGYESFHSSLSKELSQLKVDPLTNATVRRACEEHLQVLFDNYGKTGISPAIIMFDIDDLKDINDSYGHLAGDEAIKGVVAAVAQKIRANDCLYRWGGDEFILIIDSLKQLHVDQFVAKMLQAVAAAEIEYRGEVIKPTISVGLTYFNESDLSYLDTINRVDHAMYMSKITGKKGATFI